MPDRKNQPGRNRGSASRRSPLLRALLAILVIAGIGGSAALYARRMARPESPEVAGAWMLASIPARTLVAVEPGIFPVRPDSATALPFPRITLPASEDPAESAPFYRLSWFRDFGFLAINQTAREDYAKDPTRFETQLSFYRQLEAQWTPAAVFSPDSLRGPEIRIYRNPAPGKNSPSPTAGLVAGFTNASQPLYRPYLLDLGDAYGKAGRLERATDVFIALTQLCPECLEAYERFAMASLYLGRNAEAIAACESYLRRKPDDADISLLQAVIYARSGRFPEAAAAARRTLEIDPDHAKAREFLGTLPGEGSGP